jgi:hypothetical protein
MKNMNRFVAVSSIAVAAVLGLAACGVSKHYVAGDAPKREGGVTADDIARYGAFLREKDTGLVRIFPNSQEKPEGTAVQFKNNKAAGSFEFGDLAYIQIGDSGSFMVGLHGADYGFIAPTDKLNLLEVSAETENAAIAFALAHASPAGKPASDWEEERKKWDITGTKDGEITYRDVSEAIVGKTYVVRSVQVDLSDVAVVLYVDRRDADGSLILAWKIIKDFGVPTIAAAPEAAPSPSPEASPSPSAE